MVSNVSFTLQKVSIRDDGLVNERDGRRAYNSVQQPRSDRPEQIPINGGESPARESPFTRSIVRKGGVGVLKIRDLES